MIFPGTCGTQVKICGVTNPHDAAVCRDAGADAVGFNFFSGSKRYVDPDAAIPWIRDLGPLPARVAVVVNPEPDLLEKIRSAGCFEWIQFHGDETPEKCRAAGFTDWIKAVRVPGEGLPEDALDFPAPAVLLDAWTTDAYGGSGKRLDWDYVRNLVSRHHTRRFLLAGGLDVHNVRQAVRIVRPHAVDVASGVELKPGKKEEYLVREFVRMAKQA